MKPPHHHRIGSRSAGQLLRGGVALGTVAALATASVATAAPAHVTQAQSDIAFTIQQPARGSANITFESGLSNISNQAATGTRMLAFVASTDGFIVTATHQATRPSSTVSVSPRAVPTGSRVTISGDAPPAARAGQVITIMSDAFASRHTVDGIPAIRTRVRADGTYSATALIPAGRRETSYAVAIRYDGTLGPVAWLRVRAR